MSDPEEDDFQMYGTLLEPFDEDTIPKKKAFSIEDQIVTDAQGRRRFHGAFTGGFSAGFFNTVGSLEGWKPSEFKSSRSEKAEQRFQKPEDFMDDEDVGEFGIAPTVLRATSDYSNQKPNKKRTFNDGPIPGIPVLRALLEPAKETIGVKLLKQMGWKPGQGVGPRLTKSQKNKAKREHHAGKIYGCEIPEEFRKPTQHSESSSEDEADITFAPDDYEPFICKPKDNTFGMGYTGLDRNMLLSSHISLIDSPQFKMRDRNNKKVAISGQAFGVGAFENEDEDIYFRDDLSKYDFELDSTRPKDKKRKQNKITSKEKVLEGFVISKSQLKPKKLFPPPVLPKNFIPKHKARLSRFEPLPEDHKFYNYDRTKTLGRHDLKASDRSKIINAPNEIFTPQDSSAKKLDSSTFDTSEEAERKNLKEKITQITSTLPNTFSGAFKPFITNPDKQNRYEQFLQLIKQGERDKLKDYQPSSMADWEKANEKSEFEQAARLYKPVTGLVFDRFVTASSSDDSINPLKSVERTIYQHGTEEMREAAKLKKFGHLTRIIEVWKPEKLLCVRFNVPEPEISVNDIQQSRKKRGKYSVFDYYEAYQQNKEVKEGPEHITETTQSSPIELPVVTEINKNRTEINLNESLQIETIKSYSSESNHEDKSVNLEEQTEENDVQINANANKSPEVLKVQSKDQIKLSEVPETSKVQSVKQAEKPKLLTSTSLPTDPKEKMDLFKEIFLSSSESESETEETEIAKAEDHVKEMRKIVSQENPIQENKPIKGIFADLDWTKINKAKTENLTPKNQVEENPEKSDANTYGPKLPSQVAKGNESYPTPPKMLQQNVDDSKDDEWMEVDSSNSNHEKTLKKHKKHKTERYHKKHKSKHKKKKHSDRR